MFDQCWSTIFADGPTLIQQRLIFCLLGSVVMEIGWDFIIDDCLELVGTILTLCTLKKTATID